MGDLLDPVFYPRSVAVVGASEGVGRRGGDFVRRLQIYGYRGKIYPVNPRRPEIFGLKAYPSLKAVPGSIDYVIDCISIDRTLDLLTECAEKGVKVLHIFAGRASETGREELKELDKQILGRAKDYGIRLIGPNSFGVYCPKEGFCSTGYDLPNEEGSLSAAVQSGGNSTDLIRFGALRGLRFNKVVSYGNALDLDESDFLDYFAQDPETKIILCYIEGVKDGRRFFSTLRNASRSKPVIVAKGGRSKAGVKAAASHTAAVAGSWNLWNVAIRQAGAVPARNLDELIDFAVAFYFLPPIKGIRVGITGGGGGRGVLSADECEEMGLDVIPLPAEIREELKEKAPIIWNWVGNPADLTIMKDAGVDNGDVLQMMAKHPDFDLLIANVTEDWPSGENELPIQAKDEVNKYIEVHKADLKPVVIVCGDRSLGTEEMDNWRWRLFAELKTQARNARIPFYPTIGQAARAVKELINYYTLGNQAPSKDKLTA